MTSPQQSAAELLPELTDTPRPAAVDKLATALEATFKTGAASVRKSSASLIALVVLLLSSLSLTGYLYFRPAPVPVPAAIVPVFQMVATQNDDIEGRLFALPQDQFLADPLVIDALGRMADNETVIGSLQYGQYFFIQVQNIYTKEYRVIGYEYRNGEWTFLGAYCPTAAPCLEDTSPNAS